MVESKICHTAISGILSESYGCGAFGGFASFRRTSPTVLHQIVQQNVAAGTLVYNLVVVKH